MTLSIQTYLRDFAAALGQVNEDDVNRATRLLLAAYHADKTIYVIGNGQSATTSTAFALDFTKQTLSSPGQRRVRIVSLADNTAALTAWANDVNYEVVFTEQLKTLWRPGDLLLAVSVSGNSPNVIHACQWARAAGGTIMAMTGFEGGKLRDLADACIVVPSQDYGFVETGHIAIMHYWVDLFRESLRHDAR